VRVLLACDLHYALPQFDWVLDRLDEFDLVVLAGDQLDIASSVPLDAQIAMIEALIDRLDDPHRLVVSSGNHDLTGPDDAGEQCALWMASLRAAGVVTDGATVELDTATVTVCPWWDGPVGRARVEQQLRDAAATTDRPWIWVYHWPPDRSPTSWTGRVHYGDTDLRGWIEEFRPSMVLTGHVHDPPFKPDGSWADRIGDTWVFNPGRQIGPVPAYVDIDLEERAATWRSLMGTEQLTLSPR
jgi:Icc-related predicted phosphoesterase